MQLQSSVFKNQQHIPDEYTCKGQGLSPPLDLSGVPAAAKSLALIVRDPDSPGGIFTHWTVWGIDPATKHFDAGSVPSGSIEGVNDFGKQGYGGPCPNKGTHRYIFMLYALDAQLDLPTTATGTGAVAACELHKLATAELVGLFSA